MSRVINSPSFSQRSNMKFFHLLLTCCLKLSWTKEPFYMWFHLVSLQSLLFRLKQNTKFLLRRNRLAFAKSQLTIYKIQVMLFFFFSKILSCLTTCIHMSTNILAACNLFFFCFGALQHLPSKSCAQWTSSILLALKENKVSILHNFKEITDFQKAGLTFNLTKKRPRSSNSSLQITTWQQAANPPQQGQTIEQGVTVKLHTRIPVNPFLIGGHCSTMTGY